MPQHDERAFFDAFDAALGGDAAALTPWLAANSQLGIPVYRNTIASGAIDALVATFATVVIMTGEDWFRAAAREYARANPPRDPALIRYGDTFPSWLSTFPPAADAPYLGAIAELDWLSWQSWSAGDAEPLDSALLTDLSPDHLSELTLGIHPSVRLAAFEIGIPSLWLAHQAPARGGDHTLLAECEHMLFVRSGAQVEARIVSPGPYAFIVAVANGGSLLEAAEAALAADPTCALHQIVVTGLILGLFTTLHPIKRNAHHDH